MEILEGQISILSLVDRHSVSAPLLSFDCPPPDEMGGVIKMAADPPFCVPTAPRVPGHTPAELCSSQPDGNATVTPAHPVITQCPLNPGCATQGLHRQSFQD